MQMSVVCTISLHGNENSAYRMNVGDEPEFFYSDFVLAVMVMQPERGNKQSDAAAALGIPFLRLSTFLDLFGAKCP